MNKNRIRELVKEELFLQEGKGKRISDLTPILPNVVSDTVVQEINSFLKKEILTRQDAEHLAARAEDIFSKNVDFRKKVLAPGNKGRDFLRAFMKHWAVAILQKKNSELVKKLPSGYGWSV